MFLNCVFLTVLGLGVTNAASVTAFNKQRIIGGEDAPEAYSPYMAALIFGEWRPQLLCGGSIITKNLIMTAAHCIDVVALPNGRFVESFHLRVGSNQWNSGGIIIRAKKHHNHPQWDPRNIKYDLGLVVLKEPLVLSDHVATLPIAFHYIGDSEKTLVTGWGRTGPRFEDNVVHLQPTPDDLQLLHMNTINHSLCQEQMRQVADNVWTPNILDIVEICTFHSRGHGMCVGDSGSALLLEDTRELIGIVSWGFGCAAGAPDVFTRISGMRQFVATVMNVYRDYD